MGKEDKKGMFSRLGQRVNSAMESADAAFDQAGDKLKGAVKGDEVGYNSTNCEDMEAVVDYLNMLEQQKVYKAFDVVAVVPENNGFQVLLRTAK